MAFVDHLRSFADRIREMVKSSSSSPPESELERGTVALDRDGEGKEILVMSVRDERADEFVIPSTSETVANYNQEYPPTDRVIEVRFAESLDAYLSEWTVAEVLEADADGTLNAGDPYYYPESRLEPTDMTDS
ncbi:hypothetical protein [Halococcus salsus]|uniref:hypothetical protein n=1 Tax=Halococcus salsus TaxID=2162894 RepID=UPI00135AACEC|nr:hypothetical protein [Halococcus salsus]